MNRGIGPTRELVRNVTALDVTPNSIFSKHNEKKYCMNNNEIGFRNNKYEKKNKRSEFCISNEFPLQNKSEFSYAY